LSNMKIVVTGAAGFIGSHLSERLKGLGHNVIGVDSFNNYYTPELKKLNATDLEEKGISIEKRDLVTDDVSGILQTTPFEHYLNNNFIATHRLIEAVRTAGTKKFINIATSSIYGAHATEDETTAPKPTSNYGVTKLAAEQLALSNFRDKGFPAVSTRLFSVYGERERPEKLYPKLIDAILNDKSFPLYQGSEEHLRSYTYVGDIIDGLVLILQNFDKCTGEIFNLGTDQAITTGEGIKIVEDILGKKAVLDIKPKRPGDQKETHANIDKARRILGYNPSTTPQEGLKKEVDWFKEKIWKKIDLYR